MQPRCERAPTLAAPRLDCYLHRGPDNGPGTFGAFGAGPTRSDGRNLLQEAAADGWTVIRTRAEFDALLARVRDAATGDPYYAPKVLGLFGHDDLFNDHPEEELIRRGLVRAPDAPMPPEARAFEAAKIGPLALWGAPDGMAHEPFAANPPTAAEMTELALLILERRARRSGRPFGLVAEVESTDNLPNANNAMGTLRALKRADDLIATARDFQLERGPFTASGDAETLLLTAADSDGSALHLMPLRRVTADSPWNPVACARDEDEADFRKVCEQPDPNETTTFTTVNPTEHGGESVRPASRCSSDSPTQTMGRIPWRRSDAAFAATSSSRSPKIARRSLWPTMP